MKPISRMVMFLVLWNGTLFPPVSEAQAEVPAGFEQSHEVESERGEAGEVLGALSMVLLTATAATGFLMRRKRRVLFPAHKWLALALILAAIVHGGLVLLN